MKERHFQHEWELLGGCWRSERRGYFPWLNTRLLTADKKETRSSKGFLFMEYQNIIMFWHFDLKKWPKVRNDTQVGVISMCVCFSYIYVTLHFVIRMKWYHKNTFKYSSFLIYKLGSLFFHSDISDCLTIIGLHMLGELIFKPNLIITIINTNHRGVIIT